MLYQISRNGQMYGPYTIEDLQRYLASGNILPTDFAKSESMPEWVPVAQILAAGPAGGAPSDPPSMPASRGAEGAGMPYGNGNSGAGTSYEDAPNLHWGLVLLFSLLTGSVFIWIWNLVIAMWLKRVQPNATSLYFYAGASVLALIRVLFWAPHFIHRTFEPGFHTYHNGGVLLGFLGVFIWIVRLIARFSQKASLEEHYNRVEPIGLRLSGPLTFFFGGLYFQAKLNEINAMKQAARYGQPRPY